LFICVIISHIGAEKEVEEKPEVESASVKEYGTGKEFSDDIDFNLLFAENEPVKQENEEELAIAAEEAKALARKAEQDELDKKWEEYKKTYSKENKNVRHKDNKKKP